VTEAEGGGLLEPLTAEGGSGVNPAGNSDLESLRARLESHVRQHRIAQEACDSVAAVLPEPLRGALRGFDPPELFLRAETDYVEPESGMSIDVAWPAKRIGIRLTSWPRVANPCPVPDFVSTDAGARERGWLIFPVDPDAANSSEQLVRALRVIKRMGVYRR